MARTLARLSSRIAIGTLLCLAQPMWPAGQGQALAAGLSAADTAKAKQARQLYKNGQYEDAAKIFSDLSSEHQDMLVFTRNLGACYYYLRRPEPALSNLREYLQRSKDVAPDDRSEVERWIAEMEQLRIQTLAPAGVAPAVTAPPAPIATPAPVPPVAAAPAPAPATEVTPIAPLAVQAPSSTPPVGPLAPVEVAAVTSVPAPASPGSGLRVAGIACGALGLASIGTGIYFYTRATSLSDKLSSSNAPSPSDFKSGKNAETMQWVFYSVGVAAVATGSVLYYLGWRASAPSATTVAPMVGPSFAGLSAQGTF
jgi:hypothetical protein